MLDLEQKPPVFDVALASSVGDLIEAQRLRYQVFVEELGGQGAQVDHDQKREIDCFDNFATHVLLRDVNRPDGHQTVGVYRLMTGQAATDAGGFYSETEYDLAKLRQSGARLLEVGRSCLHRDYRGGAGMMHLWAAIAEYVRRNDIELLFGVASFSGTKVQGIAQQLSLLHHRHLAPEHLQLPAKQPGRLAMDLVAPEHIDRVKAMRDTPALIKAYLRLGGVVGGEAFIDRAFNTTDVMMILQTDAIGALQRNYLTRGAGLG